MQFSWMQLKTASILNKSASREQRDKLVLGGLKCTCDLFTCSECCDCRRRRSAWIARSLCTYVRAHWVKSRLLIFGPSQLSKFCQLRRTGCVHFHGLLQTFSTCTNYRQLGFPRKWWNASLAIIWLELHSFRSILLSKLDFRHRLKIFSRRAAKATPRLVALIISPDSDVSTFPFLSFYFLLPLVLSHFFVSRIAVPVWGPQNMPKYTNAFIQHLWKCTMILLFSLAPIALRLDTLISYLHFLG